MLQAISLLISLGIIVFIILKGQPLYQAMLAGIIIVVLSIGKPLIETLQLLYNALSSKETVELVFAVGLISLLSLMLKDMGFLEKLMRSIVNVFRSAKFAIIILPALIGLFPVVGGAIMSAPLVDSLGDKLSLSKPLKTTVNNIFRHAVVYFSPFNPAIIIMSGITGIEVVSLLKYLFPLGIINIIAGYFLYLHKTKEIAHEKFEANQTKWLKEAYNLFYYGSPLIVSLLLFIALGTPLLISLGVGVIIAFLFGERNKLNFKNLLLRGMNPPLMLGIAGIMVFRELVVGLEGAFIVINAIVQSGVPTATLFIIIPLLVGWISAAFPIAIGITLPLLFPLVQAQNGSIFYLVLLYASAFFSYYLSPIHLCQVVSNNYFCVQTFEAHKPQYPVLFITFLAALLIFGIGLLFIAS